MLYLAIVLADLTLSFGLTCLAGASAWKSIIEDGQVWHGLMTFQVLAVYLYGIDRLSKWAKGKAKQQAPAAPQPSKAGNVARAVVRTAGKVARKAARSIDRVSDLLDRLAPTSKPAKVILPAAWLERSTVKNRQPAPADLSPP